MIPMPIFIPSDLSSGVEMVYPVWVKVIAYFGGLTITVGILWMIVALILSITTDDRIDIMEKPHIYSLALTFLGIGVLIVSVVLMLMTGQEIVE